MSGTVAAQGTPEAQATVEETRLLGLSQITTRITELQEMLSKNIPGYETHLQQIHMILGQDEAMVHMLDEGQIATICNGLARKKQVILVEKAQKTSKKKLSEVTADDL